MSSEVKRAKVESFIKKLKNSGLDASEKHDYEGAMASIYAASYVHYYYNQYYTDVELENMLKRIWEDKRKTYQDSLDHYHREKNTVLFYDGFGLDTRGVAIMYLNALKKNGYRIIYVTNEVVKGKLPEKSRKMEEAVIVWEYI